MAIRSIGPLGHPATDSPGVSTHPSARDQRGFTLVEVMVAIFILLVGVLGVVSMVDGANAVTSKTRAREGGTNIARSVIEISRSVRYRDLTAQALLDEADVLTRSGRTSIRGTDYTIHAAATLELPRRRSPSARSTTRRTVWATHNGPVA